jgi:pyridoxamine 5'-phosphate oxidase
MNATDVGPPVDVAALREDYARGGLTEAELTPDPLDLFERWLREAVEAELYDPNAMVVSTVGADGAPSSRMVLLKGYDADGFVFYTNLGSRKGEDLAAEPRCALLFPWHPLERQVRIEGPSTLVTRDEVANYFGSRPRRSRVGAWASPQSRVVASRAELDERYAAATERWGDREEVPVPEEWGGYRVRPELIEFWQGRPGRMHDRLVYRRVKDTDGTNETWSTYRLAP